ncbi:MAG: serine/threonine protein kinase [bacterium]|nr:MAG: serine/threonine protein kinase [bacterium]
MNRPFGNYVLHERIGIGGMGEVFRATKHGPEGFKVQVALKIILPHLAVEDPFRKRFSREAKLAASLKHPNIVKVNGFDIIGGTPFIEMEYVQGADLRMILRSLKRGDRLSVEESAAVLHAVAGALQHAHRSPEGDDGGTGIIHCDLNPHNILISNLGEVKVTDFGIARAVLGDASASATVRGKLAYMSPEQMEGRKLDRRTDLFSLGIIAYQLLSGKHPFERGSEGATIAAIGKARHLPLREAVPGLPKPLYDLVDGLLSLDPEQRPASASSVMKTLEPMVKTSAAAALAARVLFREAATSQASDTPEAGYGTALTKPRAAISRFWPHVVLASAAVAVVSGAFLLPVNHVNKQDGKPAERPVPKSQQVSEPAPPPPSPVERSVILETRPAGASVLLDGVEAGRSPIVIGSLPDGSMPAVQARLYGYRSERLSIPAETGERYVITMVPLPKGTVRISAIPWARVTFRGEDRGDTPVFIEKVPVGEHTFHLRYDPLGVEKRVVVNVQEALNTVAVDMRE